jgi:hypothetical protein
MTADRPSRRRTVTSAAGSGTAVRVTLPLAGTHHCGLEEMT